MNNRSDALTRVVGSVNITGSATSYFSTPETELDPILFQGQTIKSWVRTSLLRMIKGCLDKNYRLQETWCVAWIAGSGVSYQWKVQRSPADLDVLIGIDYLTFRRTNPEYTQLSDVEISKMLNDDFRTDLMPSTKDWEGYEVTFYVNPGATDIRVIRPYAAYDLTHNEWTVHPDPQAQPKKNIAWEEATMRDNQKAIELVSRYSTATTTLIAATNPASRRNAEMQLITVLEQASALWEDIHSSRKKAFTDSGEGYGDFYNYRWQAGKKLGTVAALRVMRDYLESFKENEELETYGVTLPDTQTLIRRAAMYRVER